MPVELLPEFQEYLVSRGFGEKKKVSFYAWWVSKYLSFSNRHEDLNRELRTERFLDELVSKEHIADWQLRQAREALRLYLDHFVEEKKAGLPPEVFLHKAHDLTEIITAVRQALRLKHYSYRTERSYLDWIRRFYEYIQDVKKQGGFQKALTSADVKEYLSYLAITKRVSSSTQNQAFNALLFLFRSVLLLPVRAEKLAEAGGFDTKREELGAADRQSHAQ